MFTLRSIILCGGSGTRLWPLSRSLYPKQFMDLSGHTLFGDTVDRAAALPDSADPLVVCNEEHRFYVAAALQQKGVSGTILLEPKGRNTAPAIALAAFAALSGGGDPLLLVLPSDVQWLENDPVSKAQYEQLCADSQEVLERFLNDSGIVLNVKCPNSRVFSAEKMLQEDAARDYISYLSGSIDLASAKKGNLPHCEFPGMSALTAALPLEDAEREAVLKWANTEKVDSTTRIDYYAAIAVRQHYLVLEQFGDNAWENVSYTFEKIDSADGALGYRIIETGESIGAAEYDKILREYWDDVAKKEGVDYYDIFLPEADPPEKMADKRVDLIAKYSEGIPVELTTISDAQACRVNLSFNGKKTSAQGFGDFHFIIDNRTGEWKAYEGLTWAEPYPGFPIGD